MLYYGRNAIGFLRLQLGSPLVMAEPLMKAPIDTEA